jgi:hypothetical protein
MRASLGTHGLHAVDPDGCRAPTHVVQVDVDLFTTNYMHRGPRLEHLSPMEYLSSVSVTAKDPTEPPLTTARLVLDTFAFTELAARLREDPAATRAALEDRVRRANAEAAREWGPGRDPVRCQLRLQLGACGGCGAKDVPLSICAGCASFAYCGVECQRVDFRRRHKFICLRRGQGEGTKAKQQGGATAAR